MVYLWPKGIKAQMEMVTKGVEICGGERGSIHLYFNKFGFSLAHHSYTHVHVKILGVVWKRKYINGMVPTKHASVEHSHIVTTYILAWDGVL